jgi:hypothetical protein
MASMTMASPVPTGLPLSGLAVTYRLIPLDFPAPPPRA